MPPTMRVIWLPCLALSLLTTGCFSRPQPYRIVMAGAMVREGSVEECVAKQLQQGLSMRQAMDECTAKGIEIGGARNLDPTKLFETFGRRGPKVQNAVCSNSATDPRNNLPPMDAF